MTESVTIEFTKKTELRPQTDGREKEMAELVISKDDKKYFFWRDAAQCEKLYSRYRDSKIDNDFRFSAMMAYQPAWAMLQNAQTARKNAIAREREAFEIGPEDELPLGPNAMSA